jgi:hypothetical protein
MRITHSPDPATAGRFRKSGDDGASVGVDLEPDGDFNDLRSLPHDLFLPK